MPPKISPAVLAIIQERNLCVWHNSTMQKPGPDGKKVFDYAWVGLLGPRQDWIAYGRGQTGDEAALAALRASHLRAHEPGILGAMARLETAMNDLEWKLRADRYGIDYDDDVPF